jgi:hypothetical protein
MSNNKVITIQESGRGDAGSARAVFNALYKGYCKVFVTAVYELRSTPKPRRCELRARGAVRWARSAPPSWSW